MLHLELNVLHSAVRARKETTVQTHYYSEGEENLEKVRLLESLESELVKKLQNERWPVPPDKLKREIWTYAIIKNS